MKVAHELREFIWFIIAAALYVVVIAGPILLTSLWTRVELSFWLSYAKGVPTEVEWWKALVVSIFLPIALTLNLISFIVRLFM